MGLDHLNDDNPDEITIPSPNSSTCKPIPSDFPNDRIIAITVRENGNNHSYRVTDTTTVGPIKHDVGMPDALALYTDHTGQTITLNDDDRIADHLNDGDVLALKPNAKFG